MSGTKSNLRTTLESLHRRAFLTAAGIASAAPLFPLRAAKAAATDAPTDHREIAARVIAALDGATTFLYGTGSVFIWTPGLGGHHVCNVETLRIQRLHRDGQNWSLLGRDATMFVAASDGTRLETWLNPFTQQTVTVDHTLNDPVNFNVDDIPPAWIVGDTVCFAHNTFSVSESPMRVDDHPLHSQDDTLKLIGLRTFAASRQDLRTKSAAVPMVGAETSVSPWLPWMNMGQRRGWLITQLRFQKLTKAEDVPTALALYWRDRDADVFSPPAQRATTNQSSWSNFKARLDRAGGTTRSTPAEGPQIAPMPIPAPQATKSRQPTLNADWSDPERLLNAFIKVEGDASEQLNYIYSYANVYTLFDSRRDRHLFDRELLTSRRFVRTDGGWIRLHREVAIYRDPVSKRILERFYNPYLQRYVEVIDIHRDFNRKYLTADVGKSLDIGITELKDDVFFYRRFFVSRIAEIQPKDYPLHGGDERYELAESHNYFVKRKHLSNTKLTSVPMRGMTTSISNWIPWMEMGTAPGKLIHQIRFTKLASLDDIPNPDFVPTIARKYPDHLQAPERFNESDATNTGMGWYKDIIDKKR